MAIPPIYRSYQGYPLPLQIFKGYTPSPYKSSRGIPHALTSLQRVYFLALQVLPGIPPPYKSYRGYPLPLQILREFKMWSARHISLALKHS